MISIKKIYIVIASGSLLFLSMLLHWLQLEPSKNVILILSTLMAGFSIVKKALQSIRMKAFSIELLVTIAVIGALFIGEYEESAAVTFLFLFGQYLEARTLEKTRGSLKTLMDMAPQEATVLRASERILLPVDEVKVGDRILIQSGEKIPVDGKIASGEAFINEAMITGEPVPASKSEGDQVYSGTILDHGYLEVEAVKIGDDTAFAKIIELVEEAQEVKAKTQKYLEKFAAFYTPSILVLSILVFMFTKNIELTLTFLVIACPGALVIAAPVAIVAGIGNGAKNGILIKGGEVMENLAKLDVIVFDKTGTLTKGKPEVTSIKAIHMSENHLLALAAQVEIISEHHLGQTIVREAKKRGLSFHHEPSQFHIEKGLGIKAKINGDMLVIGNRKLLKKYHIMIDSEIETHLLSEERLGNTAILVARNHNVEGVISIADQLRNEAKDTIQKLKEWGTVKTIMLTGDNPYTAEKVAKQIGIDEVYSEMLPEEKVEQVRRLKTEGYKVGMIGDGINDAPAIALADVGLAMGGSGTDIAMETADVVLMSDNLSKVPYARALSRTTVRVMKQNLFFAVGTVGLLLAGVLLGKIFLATGMLIHELSVLIVIINAIRLVHFGKQHKKRTLNKKVKVNTPLPQ